MFLSPTYTRLRAYAARLGANCDGAIAIQFAFAILPLIGLAGFGVDYSSVSRTRNIVQESLDAAVLAAAKDQTPNSAATANNVFSANSKSVDGVGGPIFSRAANESVTGTLSGSVPTHIIQVLGIRTLPVRASSTAAVALDNTSGCWV